MSRLEDRLRDAMAAGAARIEPAPDLFVRIQEGIEADRQRRHLWRRVAVIAGAVVAALIAVIAVVIARQEGDIHMDWWIFEILILALLVVLALLLGPFIKRFGRSYAADVFRSNPGTGKSFIVLTDFAYYLIFSAYILFTSQVARPSDWSQTVGAEQVQYGLIRVGGILLIIGILHGVNLLILPVIGRLLTLNRRLDQQMREQADRQMRDGDLDGSSSEA